MVDPLEVAIAYLKQQMADQIGTRVAAKHRFGGDWTAGQKCLVVRLDGGAPDIHSPVQAVRLEMRIYAENSVAIAGLYGSVVETARATCREPVAISDGATALLHNFVPLSTLSCPLYDPEIKQDFGLAFFFAIAAEAAVVTA